MATSVTKFFRKYNKTMLAVFTIFLMVAFLLPTTLNQLFSRSPGSQVIAEAFGKKIKANDLHQVEQDFTILNVLNQVIYSSGDSREARPFNLGAFLQFSPDNDRKLNYYLLVREARNTGINISPEQVDRNLADRKIPPRVINEILKQYHLSLQDLRQVVADYLAVESYFEMTASTIKISEPELENMYKLMSNRLTAEILPVPASQFVKQVPQPSESELTAYFNEHKQEFAYPDRIQLEYIRADIDATKDMIKISPERAKQQWEEHRSEYKITKPAPQTSQKGTTSAPASQQAPIQVEMPMEQALPKVVDKMKTDRAYDLVLQAMSSIKTRSAEKYRSAPKDKETGLRQGKDVADYQQLVDQASKQYKNVKLTYSRTPLVSAQELIQTPGIGSAMVPGQQPLYINEYAFRVVPLINPPTKKEQQDIPVLEMFQDSAWLMRQMGGDGNVSAVYLFRVINVDKARLPASLDEVKAKVAESYRLDKAFQIAKKEAETLCQAVDKQKLSDFVKKPGAKYSKVIKEIDAKKVEPETFARRQFSYGGQLSAPTIMSVGNNSEVFADEAFAKLWKQPTTQPSGVRTCAVIDIANDKTAYVVQPQDKKIATTDEFKQFKPFLARFTMMSRQQDFMQNWFNPKNIHQRTGYQSKLTEEEAVQ